MPKKVKFTKATVIEAGLNQLAESGWEGVTQRMVAKKLGASTMPIFSHFATMDEFKEAILDRAWAILTEYVLGNYTGDAWMDQGIGYVLFARDHGRLFNCMYYGEIQEIRNRRQRLWAVASGKLEGHPAFKDMNPEHVGWIRHLRALLTHGIAVSVSSGFAPVFEDEDVVNHMISLCSEILFEGLTKRGTELDKISDKISPESRGRLKGVSQNISRDQQ